MAHKIILDVNERYHRSMRKGWEAEISLVKLPPKTCMLHAREIQSIKKAAARRSFHLADIKHEVTNPIADLFYYVEAENRRVDLVLVPARVARRMRREDVMGWDPDTTDIVPRRCGELYGAEVYQMGDEGDVAYIASLPYKKGVPYVAARVVLTEGTPRKRKERSPKSCARAPEARCG